MGESSFEGTGESMHENPPDRLDPEIRRIVDAAREVWVRRLIDFSRGNSLLFYRDLKVGTLDLSAETVALERLLAGETLRDEDLSHQDPPSGTTDLVFRSRGGSEARARIRASLLALQRKALGNREEKGIATLHLALGLATWPAADGGRPYAAPVLLVPAEIESRENGEAFRFSLVADPQLNPVLLFVLKEEYRLQFDESALMNDGSAERERGEARVEEERVFELLRNEAASITGFEVKRRAILANFQFAKMAMVEDLKKNGAAIAASSIVAAVAGHIGSRRDLAQANSRVAPEDLDERPAASDFLVLDADSTQHRAIALVGSGQSGVVQGPPGTGKSQTIANLITQSVAEGRSVLFVAEKRAALDAVVKRLSNPTVGLGHLVLDLHGASVSRKVVMARLATALEQIRQSLPTDGVSTLHHSYESRRKELNDYAYRANRIREPTGLSIHEMIGRLLHLPRRSKSGFRIRGKFLAALTPEVAAELKDRFAEGAGLASLLLRRDHSPWNDAAITEGRHAQEALDLASKLASDLWPQFEKYLEPVVNQLQMRSPRSLDEVAQLSQVLSDLGQTREHYGPAIFSAELTRLSEDLAPAMAGAFGGTWALVSSRRYRSAGKEMLALRLTPTSRNVLQREAIHTERAVRRWRAFGIEADPAVVVHGENNLRVSFATLTDALASLSLTTSDSFASMTLAAARCRLEALASDQRTPYRLPRVSELRARLKDAGLSTFLDELGQEEVPPEDWPARFERLWLESALDHALASEPGLASFRGRTHEQIIKDFERLDRECLQVAAARVRRLHGERAIHAMNEHFEEGNLIKAEANKKTRHISIRELLRRAPNVLTQIAPCWVASPLSVSQLLDDGKQLFDIVVFDEASQVLQEEAIPALYRAAQVVVAGDRHQLPPTTFFATGVEDEEESTGDAPQSTAAAAIGGFESLLDTLQAFLPNWLLEWHYRSEDERLITFSNSAIYSGRLITFPSARGQEAIRHVLVPHDPALGGQEETSSREVEEVVSQVLRHAATRPEESLGVITMGIRHANRVQAALDRALVARPDLSSFFTLGREERFFIKNLETVQGDERDAIILSIGYGKTSNGDLPHRFGPLTQDAGYRRLNVAVTRAKRRMCVISSFSHHDVDLSRASGRGVELLKTYLEYAANGGSKLPDAGGVNDVSLNPFEADVRDALEALGIRTLSQFGASRYRIDLVAMHPHEPGRPVLAIECDGAAYHSSATARERDRLRQEHLQRLGWRFYRIWSTDWFYSREEEAQRTFAAYVEAVQFADLIDKNASPTPVAPVQLQSASEPVESLRPHATRRTPAPRVSLYETIEEYNDRELRLLADWILSDGELRTDEELIEEIFRELPFKRLGRRIRGRLSRIARELRPTST
jgi:very-short-patch-repair endonuclease